MTESPGTSRKSTFNTWHANVARSPACHRIARDVLGLPKHMVSNSLLPWSGLDAIAEGLSLEPGQTLADLACGRGSYGREIARRASARLVGIDFSEVALAEAARAGERGDMAAFAAADFTATGLRDGSVDAVLCVDSVQFSEPPLALLRECRRVLVPGGRVAITGWEAADPDDERLPAKTRRMNLARDLAVAGFTGIEVTSESGWHAIERTLWESVLRAEPDGDPGLAAFQEEAASILAVYESRRRVLAIATS